MIEQFAKPSRREKWGSFAVFQGSERGDFSLGFGAVLLAVGLVLAPVPAHGEPPSSSRTPEKPKPVPSSAKSAKPTPKPVPKAPSKASALKAPKKPAAPPTLKASLNRKGARPKPRSPAAPAKTVRVNPSKPVLPPLPPPDEDNGAILPASPAFVGLDLPTANQALFSRERVADFYQPTSSGRLISAGFGCVRNPNFWGSFTRFHEGIDIRSVQRDDDGEPRDPVLSMGEGRVVYANRDAGSSNYGKYVVVEHDLFGPRFYSLYAHLSSVDDRLEAGQRLARGTRLGVMGRTSNEFRIDREHAHLHFEVDLMANDRYVRWSRKRGQGEPNHGLFNGANLVGMDPVRFLQFLQVNPDLGIGDFVRREPVAFRVLAPRQGDFSWVRRYPFALSRKPTGADKAWEISMTYYGLPIRVTPRRREEIPEVAWKALKAGVWPLTFANGPLLRANAAAEVVVRKGDRWRLGDKGREWMSLLMF